MSTLHMKILPKIMSVLNIMGIWQGNTITILKR